MASLGDVAARLAEPANWSPLRADSSAPAAATVTAGAGASAGTWKLQVQQLAQAQSLASAPFASATAVVGSGTLRIEVGSTAGGVFTPRGNAGPVAVAIDPARQDLAGVRDAINAAAAGVTASLVASGDTVRLVLRSADGADSSVRITANDADGNDTDAAGLSALAFDPAAGAGAGRNLTQTQAAQDAKFTLDGLALASPTNNPQGVLPGVSLTLRAVTAEPVDLSVTLETVAVRKNVNDFVNAYNALAKSLAQYTQADPGGKNRGALQAESSAMALLSSLREALRARVSGLAPPDNLSAAGIELQRDGTLAVKEAALAPLLAAPSRLAALFSQPQAGADDSTRGLGLRLKQWAATLAGDQGLLATRMEGLRASSTDNQKQQDAMGERLARTEARLRAQYQRLDSEMSRLNAQMTRMRNALGLPAA